MAEAAAYKRDVPAAEVHILDAGHFAMDTEPQQVADLVRSFLKQAGLDMGEHSPPTNRSVPMIEC